METHEYLKPTHDKIAQLVKQGFNGDDLYRELLTWSKIELPKAVKGGNIDEVITAAECAGIILAKYNSRRLNESISWDIIYWKRGQDNHNGQIIGQATLDAYSKGFIDENGNWQQA